MLCPNEVVSYYGTGHGSICQSHHQEVGLPSFLKGEVGPQFSLVQNLAYNNWYARIHSGENFFIPTRWLLQDIGHWNQAEENSNKASDKWTTQDVEVVQERCFFGLF